MSKLTVCFDIGSESIKMAMLEEEDGSISLLDYAAAELGMPQDAPQDERNRIIARTIKSILFEKKIKTKTISVSLSGQSVFVRFVKLPAVEESKVAQIVRYEAQQQVPFPIEDVEWAYQVIGSTEGGELDIVIVAVRKGVISSLIDTIIAQGVDVDTVDVSTTSLYNCFAYNEEALDQGMVLLDLGAKTTNLLICVGDKLWARAIPIGGDNFTAALCKDLRVEPEQAESLKKSVAIVTSDSPSDQTGDETTAQASQSLTKVAKRLFTEISRSVGYFRSQWPDIKIGRVMLTGGGSFMENIRGFLGDKLKIEVEDFVPFKKIAPPPQMDQEQLLQIGRLMGDVIGLGIRKLGAGKLAIDLLPRAVVQRHELVKKRVYIAAAVVMLIATLTVQTLNMKTKATTLISDHETLKEWHEEDRLRNQEIEKLDRIQSGIEKNLKKIETLQEARLYWLDFIDVLKKNKPKYVWFTSIEIIKQEQTGRLGAGMGYDMPPDQPMPGRLPDRPQGRERQLDRDSPPSGSAATGGKKGMSKETGKPKPLVVLKGYIKIEGQTSQELANKTIQLREMLESIDHKGALFFVNVKVKDYNQIENRRDLGIFEIQAELVASMPEY